MSLRMLRLSAQQALHSGNVFNPICMLLQATCSMQALALQETLRALYSKESSWLDSAVYGRAKGLLTCRHHLRCKYSRPVI